MRRGALLALSITLACATAQAQHGEPAHANATVGYELTLTGATGGERGHAMTLVGVGYEVEGLADLNPRAGLELDVEITARRGSGQDRATFARASTRTGADGQFSMSVDVPSETLAAPRIEVHVHRAGEPGRLFYFELGQLRDEALDLLTDRNRYQPGERVRAWARVRGERAGVPRAGRRVKITLMEPSGEPLADLEARTGPSGVVTAELAIPEGATAGPYQVVAEVLGDDGGASASRSIQVWRRTVERLMAEVELAGADEDGVAMVRPGGPLLGRVVVRTPSGTPVRGASVELRVRPDAEPTRLTTNAEGVAPIDVRAPAFLSGDVGRETLTARVVHAAYGTIMASAGYLMARVPAIVSVTPRGGALVPEVDSMLYVSVSDPRGRPLNVGTEVVVRGPGLPEAGRRLTLDAKGFAELTTRLPRGAAATMSGGACQSQVAATFEVEVAITPPRFTRSCALVAADAELGIEVTSTPLAAPGSSVDVEVRRRPEARARTVLLEAIFSGRAVAAAWVDARSNHGTLVIPDDILGVVHIRGRALRAGNDREDLDEPGATGFGRGAFDAVLVRPADAFGLDVSPERANYLVQERASVRMVASQPAARGWAALLVRDQAAHGGEGNWDLFWMRGALHEAAQQPADATNARFLRASLSGSLSVDPEPQRPAQLERPYWHSGRYYPPYREGMQVGRGVLRDPTALREEMLRRGLAGYEMALEQMVIGLGTNARERAPIVSGRGFHPDVIAHLVSIHRLNATSARTLGGQPITVAMIERADPGFRFDTVARRVARMRLSKLLLALLRLSDSDDQNAQRVSANLPPERWLGTLVQLNVVSASDLSDPWGRPFVFRRVTGRRPRIALSERALDWELASPGPDGRLNTADDVNDPFARAVAQGSPYAVASGEEELMRRLSALAPAQTVLSRMAQAYQRLSLAALEEQTSGPVSASGSEVSDESMQFEPGGSPSDDDASAAYDMEEGETGGGSGMGYGGLAARSRGAAESPPPLEQAQARTERPERDGRERSAGESRAEALGTLVREDFPATLFFVGEVELAAGRAEVEVPLADALTTYRLEAIAWTASGWTTSGMGRLSVDQRALVDAPVPEYATVGDAIRLPVRVENRTEGPLAVRIVVQTEGDLSIEPVVPVDVELPAREARESIVEIVLRAPGRGSLVVSIESGGEGIDAVRRPVQVLADARTARDRRVALIDGTGTLEIDVPAEASARGAGQIRLSVGARLFGDPAEVGSPLWGGWARAMASEPPTDTMSQAAHEWVSYEDQNEEYLRDPLSSALALSTAWRDDALTDPDVRRALRSIGQNLPAQERIRTIDAEQYGEQPSWLLLALAPVARDLGRRPSVRNDMQLLLSRLQQITATQATRSTDAPTTWARAAAALALTDGLRPRAEELVRRTARHLIGVGDMAWVEPEQPQGQEPRAQPTAFLALAQIELGRRGDALALVRALVDMHRAGAPPPPPWIIEGDIVPRPYFEGVDRALASAAAARLTPRPAPGEVAIALDGRSVEVTPQGAVSVAVLEGIGAPGAHRVTVTMPPGTVALAHFAVAYGMPWDVAPRRRATLEVSIDGERGARDTRAALLIHVQNRGARILTRPVVEIELPAGAELDEPSREQLAALLRGDAHMEGRTLILPLRPLAPGGWARIPLPVRWALAGTLRGLGAIAYDELGPDSADVLPVSILESTAVQLPDEGPEPERPEAEASEAPRPIPPPIPFLDRLAPEEG